MAGYTTKKIKQVFGGTEPQDTSGTSGKLSGSNMAKGTQSALGNKATKNAENTRQNEVDAQDAKIEKAMKERPEYQSIRGADGSVKKAFKTADIADSTKGLETRTKKAAPVRKTAAYGSAMSAVDALKAEGNSKDDSVWATQRKAEAKSLAKQARNQASEDSSRGVKSGMNAMMAQGGAGGGSRERMLTAASRQNMMNSQNVNAALGSQQLGISAEDAQQKAQMRQGLAGQYAGLDQAEQSRQFGNSGLEMQKANAWGNMAMNQAQANQMASGQNAQAAIGDVSGLNQYNMGGYQEKMAAMGAAQTANVQGAPGKKAGGWLAPLTNQF